MQRWIAITGLVIFIMLATHGMFTSLFTLFTLVDLWMLLWSVPAAVIGTMISLWFGHELILTFRGEA